MTRLLMNILFCTFLLTCDANSAILSKYKDGVSIDSLVENWRPTDYKTVKALLEKEKIECIEYSYDDGNYFGLFSTPIIRISKVYYKGIYIGSGELTFDTFHNPKENYKNSARLIEFSLADSVYYASVDSIYKPQIEEAAKAKQLLYDFHNSRYGEHKKLVSEILLPADSLLLQVSERQDKRFRGEVLKHSKLPFGMLQKTSTQYVWEVKRDYGMLTIQLGSNAPSIPLSFLISQQQSKIK